MLVTNLVDIGDNMLFYRKKRELTQNEVADKAGLSCRGYADIERGQTGMKVSTLLKICEVLNITPNDILVTNDDKSSIEDIIKKLENISEADKKKAYEMLSLLIR